MGSDAHVVVRGQASLLASARRRLDDLEQKWSRFLPDSEVSRLNSHAGSVVAVSADTVLLLQRAVDGWRATGGWFDPMLLDAVRAAGYDRSFEQLDPWALDAGSAAAADDAGSSREREEQERRAAAASRCRTEADAIEIDPAGLVRLPADAGFDPGGLGKGLAADVVAAELLASGADGACVNVGGDLRVMGEAPGGGGWLVDVEDPVGSSACPPLERVMLADGAVASSSRIRRRWRQDGEHRHHLIDPVRAAPSTSDVVAVAVVAAQAWQAEVLAKAAFLGGAEGASLIERRGAAALVVLTGGRTVTVGTWARWAAECGMNLSSDLFASGTKAP